MNLLQHIILPKNSIYAKDAKSYLRASEKVHLAHDVLNMPAYQKVDFDTYFNYFNNKKWLDFGQIDSLFIKGSICGVALLEIIGVKRFGNRHQQSLVYSTEVGCSGKWIDFVEDIRDFQDYEALSVRVCTLEEHCQLQSLAFGTYAPAKRQVKLGVCFIDGCSQKVHDEIDRLSNSQALDVQIFSQVGRHQHLSQIHSLIEQIKSIKESDRTHILSMTAQDFVSAECVFRVLKFFEMVFAERQDVVVSGEGISAFDESEWALLNQLSSVLKGGSKNYSFDWRFCAFNKLVFQAYGLPLPLSLPQAASEYQSRIYKEIVPINGVAFYRDMQTKPSLIQMEYYHIRDELIEELLKSNPSLETLKSLVWNRFWHNIHTYHYVAARLNLYALDHITKGVYKADAQDIERYVNNLYAKENKFTRHRQVTQSDLTKTAMDKTLLNVIRPYVGLGRPAVLSDRADSKQFVGRNHVLIADGHGGAEVARIRRKKLGLLVRHATKSYANFIKNYHKIRNDLLEYRNDNKQY